MWQITNRTPFAAQGYFDRDRDGAEYWVVAIRARFAIRGDRLVDMAERQEPVRLGPEYADEEASELVAESDISPFRPKTDIILEGFACAPDARAVRAADVLVRVGTLEKRARVFGARRLERGTGRGARPQITAPEPFERQRLSWRSALGGADPFAGEDEAGEPHPDNPIGTGWTTRWRDMPEGTSMALPSIEALDRPIALDANLPEPHGFGPLQRSWRPRLRHAGRYDEDWSANRAPLLPFDFSEDFHQAAPADQVYPGIVKGGEPVEIEGLHPEGPSRFQLPQILFDIRTRIGSERMHGRPRLVSIAIDGTTRMLDMVWNAHIPCDGRDHEVEGSTVSVKQVAGVAR